MEDSTQKEFPNESTTLASATLVEKSVSEKSVSEKSVSEKSVPAADSSRSEATLRYGGPGSAPSSLGTGDFFPASLTLPTFRGWPVQEQLPTKGAEADLYLVQAEGERCMLKLYRHRLEPKREVLNRVAEISRNHSRCFVVFKDVGFDEDTGRWYELQEYIPLGSLRDVPPQMKRSPDFLKNLVSELAEAIHCLHVNGIIHCDIKPANVLVRSLDPLDLVLTDFGISSILASDMSQKMTSLKGTPMYWAPEAFSRMIGRPCDWWGLGMMVLELLVGEHPLEGLTDSQIIRKLTLGNVEIPDSLERGWALLVKGLLTKNDTFRWGQPQVLRWLSGERNIPLRYEESAATAPVAVKIPFLFEGKDYDTLEALAQAFAASQNPWFSGVNTLRQVRRWLENNMLFDEALKLGDDITNLDPERALFRFVHSNAQGPFSLMGRCVDAQNLPLFLERVLHSEAWSAERRIVGMLGNGRLLSFYEEYLALSGDPNKGDAFFYRLLRFMDNKMPETQWQYFEAMRNPRAFLWPDDGHLGGELRDKEPPEILETLEKMKILPLKCDALRELKSAAILPRGLESLFRSVSTYARGVVWIEDCQLRDLLIPRSFAQDPSVYENLSLDEYVRAAQSHWLGQTPAILEKLDFLIETLPTLPCNPLEAEVLSQGIDRLNTLSTQKITPADVAFMAAASKLYEARREIMRRRSRYFPVAVGSGGLVFCGLRFLSGNASGSVLLWGALFLMVMIGFALRGASFVTRTPLKRIFSVFSETNSRGSPVALAAWYAIIGSVFLFAALIYFGVFTSYPYPFSFVVGGVAGGAVYYGLDRWALSKNTAGILEACGAYCVSLAANKPSR